MKYDDIAVIIPAYNAESTIRELIDELIVIGIKKEDIVIVNDGSSDRTAQIAREKNVILCSHERNKGKGTALRSGIAVVQNMNKRKILTIDADGQHDPHEIKIFVEHMDKNDVLIGERTKRTNMPGLRRLVNRTTSLVVSLLSGQYVPDAQCGFRMIDLQIFTRIRLATGHYETESEFVIKAARQGYRIGSVRVSTLYRNEKSYIQPLIDTLRFIKMAMRSLWV